MEEGRKNRKKGNTGKHEKRFGVSTNLGCKYRNLWFVEGGRGREKERGSETE